MRATLTSDKKPIAAGVCAHLQKEDVVFSTHRGHGHALAKGLAPRRLFAELFGRATGCSQGRGGSMHLFAPDVGMMGTSGIVGPCILQAAGAGYSFMLLKSDHVAVAFFGDGAVNNGAFHEGLNMAGIWKLPVLFVCENNQYATEVPFAYAAANPSVADRGASYGMPGVDLDGNDVLAIYQAAGEAVAPRTQRRRSDLARMPNLPHPCSRRRAWATTRTARARKSKPGKPAARSRAFVARSSKPRLCRRPSSRPSKPRLTPSSTTHNQFAESSPWPEPETAVRFVFDESIPADPKQAPASSTPENGPVSLA